MFKFATSICLIIFFCFSQTSFGAKNKTKKNPPQIEWDLSDMFKNKRDWSRAKKRLAKDFKKIKKCEGRLTNSAKDLEECLELLFDVGLKSTEIYSWASLQSSTDALSSEKTAMAKQAQDFSSQFHQASSFYAPEIAKAEKKKIEGFQKENKNLKIYSQYLRDVFVQSKHILSAKEEALISAFRPVVKSASGTFGLLSSADIEWPSVEMSDGKAKIDVAGYSKYRNSENRGDRNKAFQAFYGVLGKYERTFGSTLSQSVKSRTIEAKVRGYDNALSQALGNDHLPEKIYRTLVKEVNKSLPTLHRYLKIRKQMLGLKKQNYSDIYPPVVESQTSYPIEKARKMTIDAVKPLGQDYVTKLASATSKDWMDVYPRKGKRPGAFMAGSAYRLHPYVFLNHQDDYSSASTYAHEWGHALHTLYSNEAQPYPTSQYSIFIAEIAAIVNEALMLEKAIKEAKNDDEKLFYLGYALEFIKGTYFRQTQFGEFELALHDMVEKGDALTGQKISKVFGKIARRYYGHDKGIMNVDEKYFTEWAFVPHFYYGFYVYQYATSIAAAYHFADKILAGDQKTLAKYKEVLKAGGSKYPHEILLDAGLDLTKPAAYKAIDKKANWIMDEMENILKNQKRQPKA
jgi:oligoendopeptidase F